MAPAPFDTLATFFNGWQGGGELGNLKFSPIFCYARDYFSETDASKHFCGIAGIDIATLVEGLPRADFYHQNIDTTNSIVRIGWGRSPKRYTATVFVALNQWFSTRQLDRSYILNVHNLYSNAFDQIVSRAGEDGRLYDKGVTQRTIAAFLRGLLELSPIEVTSEEYELILNRCRRHGIVPKE